jgi:hypothetical protein
MKSKFLVLCCITIITTVLMLSGCVTSLNSGAGSSKNVTVPLYTAVRTNNTTVTVILADLNGANSSKGLHVESPSISSPDVISPGTDVPMGKEIKITDANLSGKVNLVITSSVNGNSMIVLNGTI